MESYELISALLFGLAAVLFLAFKVQFAKDRIKTILKAQSAHDIDITSASISRGAVYFDVEYTDNNGEKVKRSGIVHGVFIPDGDIYWNDHN